MMGCQGWQQKLGVDKSKCWNSSEGAELDAREPFRRRENLGRENVVTLAETWATETLAANADAAGKLNENRSETSCWSLQEVESEIWEAIKSELARKLEAAQKIGRSAKFRGHRKLDN